MQSLQVPLGGDWGILVVNNNSTDETARVLEWHVSKLPWKKLAISALRRSVHEILRLPPHWETQLEYHKIAGEIYEYSYAQG